MYKFSWVENGVQKHDIVEGEVAMILFFVGLVTNRGEIKSIYVWDNANPEECQPVAYMR